jgi:hypothetical protein
MSIEAMKQALDALEELMPTGTATLHLRENAIATLRQAIAEAEKEATLQEISDIGQEIEWDTSDMAYRSGGLSVEQAEKQEKLCKYCGGIGRVVCDCRCMPEQEPVAWVSDVDFVEGQFVEGRARRVWWECNTGVGQPLYTALPKREWVSLTDDEVHEAAIKCVKSGQSVDAAIRAIEAKLKERNT